MFSADTKNEYSGCLNLECAHGKVVYWTVQCNVTYLGSQSLMLMSCILTAAVSLCQPSLAVTVKL